MFGLVAALPLSTFEYMCNELVSESGKKVRAPKGACHRRQLVIYMTSKVERACSGLARVHATVAKRSRESCGKEKKNTKGTQSGSFAHGGTTT